MYGCVGVWVCGCREREDLMSSSHRIRIAVGALSAALLAAGALSTRPLLAARPQQASAAKDDTLIYADEINYDAETGLTQLEGNVEVVSGQRTMRSDHMTL